MIKRLNKDFLKRLNSRLYGKFDPYASLNNVVFWWKSDFEYRIKHTLSSVHEYVDATDNNNLATQTIASDKPTTFLNKVNGLNAITFDGSTDHMIINNLVYDWKNNDFSIFVVARLDSGSSNWRGLVGNRFGAGASSWFTLGNLNSTGNIGVELGGPGGVQYYDSGVNMQGGAPFVLSFIKNGTNGSAYLNTTLFDSKAIISGNCGGVTNDVYIGRWVSFDQGWDGEILDVIISQNTNAVDGVYKVFEYAKKEYAIL